MESKIGRVISLALLISLFAIAQAEQLNTTSDWTAFKLTYGKSYGNRIEESMREKIFQANKQRIDKFNAEESKKAGYRLGLSHLSDWTESELKGLHGFNMRGSQPIENTRGGDDYLAQILSAARSKPLPDSVDWRKVEGRVTSVKDQGHCGSCWAFSTTGLLEGQQLKVTGRKDLVELSNQNLVDCVMDYGCRGNWPTRALLYIYLEGGIQDEASYPYNASRENQCAFDYDKSVMNDRGPITLPKDEEALKAVVAEYGPVSVAIAVDEAFHYYESGVYNSKYCHGQWLSYAVLVVGYGTDPKLGDYWIVVSSACEKLLLELPRRTYRKQPTT